MTGEEEQTIPVDPRTVDWTKTMQHEREVIWKNWATYQEDLVKARDEVIKRDNEKFANFTMIANETEEELQHYKDMLFYLLHRPYKPKPKSNKRNTKNRGRDTYSCSVAWMFVLVNQRTGLTITVRHFSSMPAKFPLIGDLKDSTLTARTKAILEDYLKIDFDVLERTEMSAFLLSKVTERDGAKRVETVYQLLQKLREDITDMRAAIMKQITDVCTGR
jgi:hypothetical protein